MSDVAVDNDNNVHLVYGRGIGSADGRWYQWSSDGGETWSNARLLYPGVEHASGVTGGFSFGIDSGGQLHMVNSYGRRDGEASAWHMVWLGTRWSEPEELLGTQFHAHQPRLAIALGNELNFVAVAPRQKASLIYRVETTNSPNIPPQEVPTPVIEQAAENESVGAESAAEPTPVVSRIPLSDEALSAPQVTQPFNALLLSVAASSIAVLVVVVVMRRRTGR
jgi:hypothetical protein